MSTTPQSDTVARITAKLEAAFAPEVLEVRDESDQHIGHGGHRPGITTHLRVRMQSSAFDGQSRVVRARMVHQALAEELAGDLHALALELSGVEG